jgi:hypothetical protein
MFRSNSWSDSFINLAESLNPSPTLYADTFLMPNVAKQMSPLKRHFEELAVKTTEKDDSLLDPKFEPLYESLKGLKYESRLM